MSVIETQRERRAALKAELDASLANPVPEERAAAEAKDAREDTLISEIRKVDERIAELEAMAEREAKSVKAAEPFEPRATVGAEPTVYGPGSGHSYLLDIARHQLNHGTGDGGIDAARERLARHAKELSVDLPARAARGAASAFEQRVNPNRTDGQGGYFVPPLWLVDQYIELPRAGRPLANAVHNLPLPAGTDSINVPKVATGTATGIQSADNAAVTSTDLTDATVSAPVRTIAGQQDIAMQLLDQSPISFDEVVLSDLLRDYATRVDVGCISGSGSSGQVTGLDNVSGALAITYTQASPTAATLYNAVLGAASQIATNLLDAAEAVTVFMHPRRWYWLMAQADSQGRPLVVPAPNGSAFNAIGSGSAQAGAQGPAGYFAGLPTVLDASITTVDGAGTNQDRVYVVATNKIYLWEGAMRSRALSEVLSGTLQVRLQVYNYLAFMANRLPKATAVISGTGLVAPSGF